MFIALRSSGTEPASRRYAHSGLGRGICLCSRLLSLWVKSQSEVPTFRKNLDSVGLSKHHSPTVQFLRIPDCELLVEPSFCGQERSGFLDIQQHIAVLGFINYLLDAGDSCRSLVGRSELRQPCEEAPDDNMMTRC